MSRVKRRVKASGLLVLLVLLSAGTISNQLRLNAQSAKFRAQAANGQRSLNRQCALVPISKKIYADAVNRRVISADDFGRIVSTAAAVCPQR